MLRSPGDLLALPRHTCVQMVDPLFLSPSYLFLKICTPSEWWSDLSLLPEIGFMYLKHPSCMTFSIHWIIQTSISCRPDSTAGFTAQESPSSCAALSTKSCTFAGGHQAWHVTCNPRHADHTPCVQTWGFGAWRCVTFMSGLSRFLPGVARWRRNLAALLPPSQPPPLCSVALFLLHYNALR